MPDSDSASEDIENGGDENVEPHVEPQPIEPRGTPEEPIELQPIEPPPEEVAPILSGPYRVDGEIWTPRAHNSRRGYLPRRSARQNLLKMQKVSRKMSRSENETNSADHFGIVLNEHNTSSTSGDAIHVAEENPPEDTQSQHAAHVAQENEHEEFGTQENPHEEFGTQENTEAEDNPHSGCPGPQYGAIPRRDARPSAELDAPILGHGSHAPNPGKNIYYLYTGGHSNIP